MGFNKRYISKESLKCVFRHGGAEGIINYLTKPDALIIDSDCNINLNSLEETIEKIRNWVLEDDEEELTELQIEEQKIELINYGGKKG